MRLLDDLRMYARFARGLRPFLLERPSLDEARAVIRRTIAERESNFLRLVERGIYGYPKSPYLPLLRLAGVELADIRSSVREHGIEHTLRELRAAGVYVSFEECKGRTPIVRNGLELAVDEHSFDNPFASAHYYSESGGSTGAGTRVAHDLDHMAIVAAYDMVMYEIAGVLDYPKALWRGVLPDGSAIDNLLRFGHYGYYFDRWFSPRGLSDLDRSLLRFRIANLFLLACARAMRVRFPWPERVPIDQAEIVARWARDALAEHGRCLILTPTSQALRVCVAAEREGIDMTGAVFRIAGEPVTPAKVAGIERTGARAFTNYGFTEAGRIAFGCGNPVECNDVHLAKGIVALIQHDREVPGTDVTVPAFNFTSLLPTSPRILLNAESDDYGIVEQRSCGCVFEQLGCDQHLRQMRSFCKLTGEGVTLIGSEMIHILEEVLPARFGGGPLDYQLLEEEDEQGFTKISLVVSPRIEIADESEVIGAVLDALHRSGTMADAVGTTWSQAGSLRVKRMEPIWTGRGKLMSLYVAKNAGRTD